VSGQRIAMIGARRVRQGLGPFVARDLMALGAEVPAVLGTSAASAADAAAGLRPYGVDARPYHDLDALLAAERPDALAILSPAETHERYLRAALDAGVAVLCEKPFVWGRERLAETTAEIAAAFETRGLLLRENCQWPYTLDTFDALHPGVRDAPLERFDMRLSPSSAGEQMLGDALSHPLSALQALLWDPEATVSGAEFASEAAPEALEVRFVYHAQGRAVPAVLRLVRSESVPREAAIGLNGCSAQRLVRKSDYSMLFRDGDRSVPLPDPLRLLLERFVGELETGTGPRSRTREIVQRMEMLETIVRSFRGEPA